MNPNQSKYNKTYEQKLLDQGFVRKRVLIPKDKVDQLLKLVRYWRREALLKKEK